MLLTMKNGETACVVGRVIGVETSVLVYSDGLARMGQMPLHTICKVASWVSEPPRVHSYVRSSAFYAKVRWGNCRSRPLRSLRIAQTRTLTSDRLFPVLD